MDKSKNLVKIVSGLCLKVKKIDPMLYQGGKCSRTFF